MNPFVVRFDGDADPLPDELCDKLKSCRLLKTLKTIKGVRELGLSKTGEKFLQEQQ